MSETTVTAIVRDEEGRRFGSESITWAIDAGTIVMADSTTSNVGEATATIRSTTNHETATVTTQVGAMVSRGYVEYANPGDPYIRILEPTSGAELTEFAPVLINVWDTESGDATGFSRMCIYVDGEGCGSASDDPEQPRGLETFKLANGAHILTASVTDFEGNIMWSQSVPFTTWNVVSEMQLSQTELFRDETDPGEFTFSGSVNMLSTWQLTIKDESDNVIFSDSGDEGTFNTTWDGRVNGNYIDGIYRASLSCLGWVTENALFVSSANAQMLITATITGVPQWDRDCAFTEINAVMDACRARGVPFTAVADPPWLTVIDQPTGIICKKGMEYWLKAGYRYWFNYGHGGYHYEKDIDNPDGGRYHAFITFKSRGGGEDNVCGDNYWLPPRIDRVNKPAFSDLELYPNSYNIVMSNSCWSAGRWYHQLDLSIANAFGIYGAGEIDQTYVGWAAKYCPRSFPLGWDGTAWTWWFWHYMGEGYTIRQAVQWANTMTDIAFQALFLYLYGGPDVTYLTPY